MMPFTQSLYNALPSSRPVTAQRPAAQPAEAVAADRFLKPHNLDEAIIRTQTTLAEMIGFMLGTAVFISAFLALIIHWMSTYMEPFGTYLKAECLVLNSTQASVPTGFNREPLYRAEIYVYVFNTSAPVCCCPNIFGANRCAEWEAVAYDNIIQSYTSGDKTEYLNKYGYPGTFHHCWHSPKKDQVLLTRSVYGEFLMAPLLALLVGLYCFRMTVLRVQSYRESRYFYDKFTGKFHDDEGEVNTIQFTRKPGGEHEDEEEEEEAEE